MALSKIMSAEDAGILQSISDDERRKQRPALSITETDVLALQDSKERYAKLLSVFAGQEEIWTSFSDSGMEGWINTETGRGVTPIWPTEQSCTYLSAFCDLSLEAVPIPIVDWIDDVLPVLHADKFLIAAFPVDNVEVVLLEPAQLLFDLEEEWKKFAKSIV